MFKKTSKKIKKNSSYKSYLSQALIVMPMAVIGLGMVHPETTQAANISGLYTTGVDDLGNLLPVGIPDNHYTILETGSNAITMNSHPWLPNGPNSLWLWENSNGLPTFVTRTFRTTFDLTGLDPSTASITGRWITDDSGLDIRINGISTGQTSGGENIFDFNITNGFVSGINTLDFVVQDAGVISAFRVTEISGTAFSFQSVPESSNLVGVWGIATLLGAGTIFKRRT
ncbi:MAG TPA: hypothetical protein DCF68_09055 [Cyanothece sp. UBA12306]|nr:hypothetical protein [Cyanothece sp. UBA12306]